MGIASLPSYATETEPMIRSLATLALLVSCLAFAGPTDGPPGTLIVLNKTDNTV